MATQSRTAPRISADQTEDQSFLLAEASPDAIFVAVGERFVYLNPAALRLFGATSTYQLLGQPVIDRVHPDDRAFAAERSRCLHEERADLPRHEHRYLRLDGTAIDVEVSAVPFRYNGADGALAFLRDITRRKRAEEEIRLLNQELEQRVAERTRELHAMEAQLQETLNALPIAVFFKDRDGRYLGCNRVFTEVMGVSAEDIRGKAVFELWPGDLARVYHEKDLELMAKPERQLYEFQVRDRFKQVRQVMYAKNVFRNDRDEVAGIIGAFIDITERKRAEDELRVAKAEAERANNAKSRFLAAASHDLRQPLAALSLYVDALEHQSSLTEIPVMAEKMKASVVGLSEMLTKLLDLSKLEAGVVTPKARDFALAGIISNVIISYLPEAEAKGLVLRSRHTGVIGHTDPVLFLRIIGNLCSNAIRYTDHGGVLIGCRRRQGKWWVEVWDTGIGIPADKTAEIFEEFRQLGNDERDQTKGTGLGLAIVAKTAALLGLQVRVQSRPGKGSLFAVELPLGQAVGAAVPRRYAHRPLRIALVEDNAEVAAALAYALSNIGHKVVVASSGADLLSRLDDVPPDVVISDYRLAGAEDGLDVIDALRMSYNSKLPAILVTGDTNPAIIRRMAEKGITVHHKPVDLDALRATIADITQPGD